MTAPWTIWSWDPSVILALLGLLGLYVYGLTRLRPRTLWDRYVVHRGEVICFVAGVLLLFLALESPLDLLSDRYLFSAHMLQHLILMLAVPPLLLKGTPDWVLRPVLRIPGITATIRFLTKPIIATALYSLDLILWHMPYFYDLTLVNNNVHVLEHICFLVTSLIMWWPIFSPLPELPRLPYAGQMLYLFVQSLVPAVVGAVITFSGSVIYAPYAGAPRLFGISAIEDQQIAGLLMKILGGIALWGVVTIQFFQWFNQEEHETEKQISDASYPLSGYDANRGASDR